MGSLRKNFIKLLVVFITSGCLFSGVGVMSCSGGVVEDVALEGNYILSCQYLSDTASAAYGAINNVLGDPTWVVPGENAIAIMGLVKATEITGNNTYKQRANLNADYLVRMQDQNDGAWHDQYSFASATNSGKSLRHTAEVMIAFDKLGYDANRYDAMKNAAGFILANQNVANKGGIDDGLVAGGKDANGNYQSWRWTSDNAFAYQALRSAANWARLNSDNSYAADLDAAAGRIAEGINNYLSAGPDHWKRVIDANGNTISDEDHNDWISYAPLMLDMPLSQAQAQATGEWIHATLQKTDGSVVWDDEALSDRKSPGYSFQAILAWLDSGQVSYADAARLWAENSGLWQKTANSNDVPGGWIDWVQGSTTAPDWQRFIDTSAYYIMVRDNGYDFSPAVVPEPSTLAMLLFGVCGCLFFRKKKCE